MKKIGLLFFIIISTFFIGCKSKKDITFNTQNIEKKWQLVSLEPFSDDEVLSEGIYLNLSPTKSPKGVYRIYNKTEKIFIHVDFIKPDKIKIEVMGLAAHQTATTSITEKFIQILPLVTNYSIENEFLILENKEKGLFVKLETKD